MPSQFDADTAVQRLAPGCYAAMITPRWNVGDKPNGGYLLAIALRAAAAELPHADPFTVTGHFLRAPQPGPTDLEVEVVRAGRSHSTAMVRLSADGSEAVRVLATFGDLGRLSGPTVRAAEPPDFPPVEQCPRAQAIAPGGFPVEIARRFEYAVHPATGGWARGAPTGRAEVGAWLRFADGQPFEPITLPLVVDALPPAVFDIGAQGWVPTVELTAHVRARPAPGWLRVWVTTRFLAGGYLEEDAEVWDSDDTLVAQSRQLARLAGPVVR